MLFSVAQKKSQTKNNLNFELGSSAWPQFQTIQYVNFKDRSTNEGLV